MSGVVILVAVVAVCAFAVGYAFGAAPIQEELKKGLEQEKTERMEDEVVGGGARHSGGRRMSMWNKEGEEDDEGQTT